MNAHFGSPFLDEEGKWKSQVDAYNVSADVSPTGSQMPRLLGLAWASRVYRELGLADAARFSRNGDEIASAASPRSASVAGAGVPPAATRPAP